MNAIEWTTKAVKQLRKMDRPVQVQIRDDVTTLVDFPDVAGVKKLTNHQHSYRLRSGNYRIFFEFDGVLRIVLIEEVKKRDERTY